MNSIIPGRIVCALASIFVALSLCVGVPAARAEVPPELMASVEMPAEGLNFHYLERYQPAIDLLADKAPPLVKRAKRALGIERMPTVEVWVLPRVADYFGLRGEPNRAPEWAVGLSFSGEHTIIVAHGSQRPPQEVMFTFAHELAHVAVDQARGSTPVPRWFHEGFAVFLAQEWTAERSEQLARAAAGGRLPSFATLSDSFPGHQQSASLAYDQSFHFVRWLQAEYGEDFWAGVMDRIAKGASFDAALAAESGASLAELEARWHESLSESTTLWSVLADETVIFFGAGVFFILAYAIARRRRRRQLASMEDDNVDEWSYDASRYPLPGEDHSQSK
jgi:hypothetical protein